MNRYFYQFPKLAAFFVSAFVLIFLGVWIWLTQESWSYGRSAHLFKGIGSAIGVTGYTLFSLSLFLASRWKKLEDWIGGLDQVYQWHHKIGLSGFYLILAHPWVQALKWLPNRLDRFFLFIFPIHNRTSVNLGSIAYLLMILIIVVTIFKWLPYDKWKLTHKFMALVFILASLHFLLSAKRFDHSFASLALLFIPMALGLFGIIYRQLLTPYFFHHNKYSVTEAKKLNDNIIQIALKPLTKSLHFIPGQYAFFSFKGTLSSEQHPFTVSSIQGDEISILVKCRGNYTRSLYDKVAPGDQAFLEGPYGRFDYTKGTQDQIWIAGGIGIVPFLAWGQSLSKWQGKITLYYCFHRVEDAIFQEAFQHMQTIANFKFLPFCSEKQKRLSIDKILEEKDLTKKDIFMCGPRRLTNPFFKELQQAGVKTKHIHFEDFEFF